MSDPASCVVVTRGRAAQNAKTFQLAAMDAVTRHAVTITRTAVLQDTNRWELDLGLTRGTEGTAVHLTSIHPWIFCGKAGRSAVMKFGSDSFSHEACCSQGHSSASTIATIQAALAADPSFDSSAITINMLGPVAVLEGYIAATRDRDKAISIAAMIVGFENVHDRMLSRVTSQ